MSRAVEPDRHGRHRRLRLTLGIGLLTVCSATAGLGAGYWLFGRGEATATAGGAALPATTAEVTRTTLTATEAFSGTLEHGDARTVTSAGQGIVTRIAETGSAVERGSELYRLNERPVSALVGEIPMYRDLRLGATGQDVRQLEANLTELGYLEARPDREFGTDTAEAVRAWQEDLGVAETGEVAQSDIVFLPGAGRVDATRADVGERVPPGAAVLDVTGRDQVAVLEVEVADRDLLTVGTEVDVRLPDGGEVPGTVTGAEAGGSTVEQSGGAGEAAPEETVITVEVTLDEPADESLLGSPVEVEVAVEDREDVLAVPVNALLALDGGRYGLEVVADDTTSVVPVTTGLFAGGEVEVTGKGIEDGTVVGVAGR